MSTKFYGWTGRHIRVDLTNSDVQVVEDNPDVMKNYLGARGLGIKYMMDEIDPKIDAFEPQNRFIIATGPLTCMPPAGNRTYFVTKSPLTGGIANAGVDNLPAVIKAGRMCNDMGMDTISAGVTVGCAMELFERGVLPDKDVGYPLKFGDAEGLLDLVQKMASREGFGWIMGEGSYRLADRYGHPELSMTVKKQELPNYDPRGVKGQGLAFVTNNRGADHCRAEVNCSEIYETTMLGYWSPGKDVDRHAIKGKAKMTKHYQDYCAWAYDSLGFCYFLLMDTPEQDVVDLLESATGVDFGGVDALNKIGERIFTLERLFNLKAGMSAKDDTLPKRFLKEPMPEGPSKGQVFEQDQILPEYYKLRGWDESGVPGLDKLKDLNIL